MFEIYYLMVLASASYAYVELLRFIFDLNPKYLNLVIRLFELLVGFDLKLKYLNLSMFDFN